MTNGRLMKVKSIPECSPLEYSTILLTCIKRYLVLKTNFLSFLMVAVLHRYVSVKNCVYSFSETLFPCLV